MIGHQEGALQIIQYNTWKSVNKVMAEFMIKEEVRSADILAIQEPWRNPFNGQGYNPSGGPFRLIDAGTASTRTAIYLNKRIRTEEFEVRLVSEDLITIALHIGKGVRKRTILLHNVYCPPEPPTSRAVSDQLLQVMGAVIGKDKQILLGDFNLHYPLWGKEGCGRHRLADHLIKVTEEAGMSLILPPGEITRRLVVNKNTPQQRTQETTVDLVFSSQSVADSLILCGVNEEIGTGSDHLPIETILALGERYDNIQVNKAWKRIDGEAFRALLSLEMPEIESLPLQNKEQIDQYIDILTRAIQAAAEAATPDAYQSFYDKAW